VHASAKSFEFYRKNNCICSGKARQEIKKIYTSIQAKQLEYAVHVEKIFKNKSRTTLNCLDVLQHKLLVACREYATKTKYYQHSNLASMPSCWWAQSSKEGGNMYYKYAKHVEFVKQVMARQMCDPENDEFFDTYELESSKWYANWARYRDRKPRDMANTWLCDSCCQLPAADNDQERLQRFEKDFFPELLETDHAYRRAPAKRGPEYIPRNVHSKSHGPTAASHKKVQGPKAMAARLADLPPKSAAKEGGDSFLFDLRMLKVFAHSHVFVNTPEPCVFVTGLKAGADSGSGNNGNGNSDGNNGTGNLADGNSGDGNSGDGNSLVPESACGIDVSQTFPPLFPLQQAMKQYMKQPPPPPDKQRQDRIHTPGTFGNCFMLCSACSILSSCSSFHLPLGSASGNDSGEGGGVESSNGEGGRGRGRSAASSSLLSRARSGASGNKFPRMKQIPPAKDQPRQDGIQTSGVGVS